LTSTHHCSDPDCYAERGKAILEKRVSSFFKAFSHITNSVTLVMRQTLAHAFIDDVIQTSIMRLLHYTIWEAQTNF
jgi:hypothetical protein